MNNTNNYLTITPLGAFTARFPLEDDESVQFEGNPQAIALMDSVLTECCNKEGVSLSREILTPFDYFFFCQPKESGIKIIRPLEDLAREAWMKANNIKEYGEDGELIEPWGTSLFIDQIEEPMPTLDDATTLSPMDRVRLAVDLARLWAESKTAVDAERQAAIGRQMSQAKAVLLGFKPIAKDDETDEFGLVKSGKKTRERINSQVADLVNQIKAGARTIESLTSDELALFRQYSGKGGLTDNSQYEYYTPTHIAEGMWDLMKINGFGNGNVLEPSTGAGVFSATKTPGAVITGTEIDPIAATVNQALHKDDIIMNQSFEKLAVATPDNFFDSVIGNVPFGDARGASANDDPEFKNEKRIERYFIDRVIDKTRPGGLICLVVPTQVIGNKDGAWQAFRAKISRKAEFLGGHKLPSKTFGKQGTNVVVDIIVMRKHPSNLLDKVDSLPSDTLKVSNVLWDEFIGGTYWQGEGKKFIKGTYVPPNPDKFRSMEEVIPADGTTPESLKAALSVHFDSRIDWKALDSQEPTPQTYKVGDRRVINGKDCEFDGIGWNPVLYGDDSTPLDKGKFGASTMAELEGVMGSPASMLAINSAQAFNVLKNYPNMIGEQQKMAIEFAISQPQEKFAEQAYRGSLIGSMVTSYIAKQTAGRAEATDRDALIAVLNAEYALMGHPKSVKGFLLEGEMARYFGAYLGAIDQDGKVSPVITDGIDVATGYKSDNIQSIVDYLLKDGTPTTLDEIKGMYKGNLAIKGLGDIADIDGIAILPSGDITTTKNWCSGEIYLKAAELQSAMEGEQDPRVSDHWNRLTSIMMGKAKRTAIEDIGFGLRDKWIDNSYKLEFFANNGFESIAFASNESVVKTSETGEVYTGTEVNLNSDSPAGEWMTTNRRASKFEEQLAEHYMNGRSIGHNVKDKQGQSADERKAELRTAVNALEEEFKAFMQSHPNFLELENTYNATFNNYVEPDYEIGDLGLKDASGAIKLHWYQNQGVRWMSDHGTGILGFDVGLGKSYSALAYSAYDRQMGRSNKHLIVVPNSVLGNWYMESKKFFGNHNSIMFVGFEPEYNKDGSIKNEPVLDEKGQPKVNAFTNEIEYQDLLRKDSPEEVYAKMHKIPASKVGMVIMTEEKFGMIPMREENRIKYADGWAQKNMISNAQLKAIQSGEESPQELRSPKRDKNVLLDATYNEDKQGNRDQQRYSDDGTLKAGELPYFEDMGFDRVIVDELHRFKNSFGMSDSMSQLAYLPNAVSSKRARDMAMKASYLRERYNGKGMIGLTATPVTNSPIEIYNMLSLVIDQAEFERMGIFAPDDFVRQFSMIDMVDKVKVSGDIKPTEGLKGFKSLNALRAMFHRYANMKKPVDVDPEGNDLKLPTAVEFHDQSPMNDEQSALYVTLRDEARALAKKEKGSRSMFSVIRDMDRVTTDIDMYYKRITFILKLADKAKLDKLIADMPPVVKVQFRQDPETGELTRINNKSSKKDDENIVTVEENKPTEYQISGDSITFPCPDVYEDNVMNRTAKFGIEYVSHPLMPKYAKMIANMQFELDRNGKQIIFTEEKTQHGKVFRLVTNHLPVTPDQVGIINADTASGEKLQQISDAYNQGLIKIVICNKKAEVGVNLQKGTSAIHHLTLPWTPASIQQRNGRGVRQGNTMSEVHVYYYQAMGSFDEYRLDLLKNKAAWIENLMDKNSSEDTAENADATSAMDQMALLAENKEEFLATMQKRKEQKDLEEKKRRDKAAVIKLNQLGSIEQALSTYDESLKKALDKAQDDIDKAQAKLDKAKQDGEEPKQIKSLESYLSWAKNKLEKVEPTLKAKKDLMESQKRQTLSLFKGQATKGELPFDIKAAENPLTTILLKNGTLVTKGATFKYKSTIFEIVTVDRIKKKITVKNLVGHGCTENHPYDAQDFLEDAVEVHYTPDEMAQFEWLDSYHGFAELTEQPKEFIVEHQAEIKYSEEVLWRDALNSDNSQLIARDSKYRDTTIVYPDPNDRQLTEQLTEMYKTWKITGGGTFNERKFNIYMPVLLGSDWKAQIESTLKIMPDADITAKASAMLSEKIKDFPQSTVEECQLLRKRIEGDYWNEPNCFKAEVKKEMAEFMDAGQYINNRLEVETIIADVIDNAKVPINNRIVELKQQAAQEAIEKLKDSPDYKEIPADIVAKFKAISIDIWYSQEELIVDFYKERRTLPPFSTLFLHDNKGFNGKLKAVKDIVKARFNAEWAKEIVKGSSRHAQSWTIPAKKPLTTEQLESLYNIID